jgi:3',5'-cyclic AMP phosphodiesterase CpdA
MLFDLYVPTRTADQLEVRLRSSCSGPVLLRLGSTEVRLERPRISYQDRHFYRHTFDRLPSASHRRLAALHLHNQAGAAVEASTLPAPPGPVKLRIGLLADLHLPLRPARIEDYRAGTKRLLGLAHELAHRYIQRLESLGADAIVLLGDLVDPCTPDTLAMLREILHQVAVPCYPIIGNHEPWSPGGAARFFRMLELPEHGYYTVRAHGVRLLLLSTPEPGALDPGSAQYRWLQAELDQAAPSEDIVLFSHFSLLLHPCVQGPRNDGYQLLDHHRLLLRLLARYPNVRVFSAGHKNVPSRMTQSGIVHLLSPQLIQAPCAYDLLHLYQGGVARTTHEIDEQHYCELARAAYRHDWEARYGTEASRNFCVAY